MTREEAINRIMEIDIRGPLQEDYDALNMAIKALEQEPCEDAISRQAVDEIKELMTDINGDTVYAVRMSELRQLPSVNKYKAESENALKIEIPKGTTNSDVFKVVFGYAPATDAVVCNKADWCTASEPCNYCTSNPDNIGKEEDWWNAPYKAESEKRNE